MREREPKLHLQKKLVKSVANMYSKWRNLKYDWEKFNIS